MAKSSNNGGQRETLQMLLRIGAVAVVPGLIAILVAQLFTLDAELEKSLYSGAITLIFVGLVGGIVKFLLDAAKEEVDAANREREDAATFVSNVLADLKQVYDRVERARILIPAHQSVKTYDEEMQGLIEACVQLRNVKRAFKGRTEGIDQVAKRQISRNVEQMEVYLTKLTTEFRDNYKALSDKQRGCEMRTEVMLKHFVETQSTETPPNLSGCMGDSLTNLKNLSDFMGDPKSYEKDFEDPLDEASHLLRSQLARILGSKSAHVTTVPGRNQKRERA